MEHVAIVQQINDAERRLLGMLRPYYSNTASNPIIEQPTSETGQSKRSSGPENLSNIHPEHIG